METFLPTFSKIELPYIFQSKQEDILMHTSPGKWIGRSGPIEFEWPPRSPDLTPLDFYQWSHVKALVLEGQPQITTVNELRRERIKKACASINPAVLHAEFREWKLRLWMCIMQEGLHFEQFL